MTVQLNSYSDNAYTHKLEAVKVHINAHYTCVEEMGALWKARPKYTIASCSSAEIENMGD